MPAPKRVPDARITEALASRGGNVSAAAADVGMSRNSLYKRIEVMQVDRATLAARAASPSPIKTRPRRPTPLRLLPAHEVLLREAKFDLAARYRVETDQNTILEQFIEEAFPAWLAVKLGAKL